MNVYIKLVVEDELQEQISRKVLAMHAPTICIQDVLGKRGNTYIRNRLVGFNQAARYCPYLVLTDLDLVECAPQLIAQWIDFPLHPHLLFRVAVREADVPDGTARVGKQYNSTLTQFIHYHWDVEQASQQSKSLLKFIQCIQAFPGINAERRFL